MPAPLNNTNAARDGIAPKIRVRVESDAHANIISALLDTEQRGRVLWQAALQAADLIILDADGTICDRDTGELLPLACEIYNAHPRAIAIATNQGGPACHDANWAHSDQFPALATVEARYTAVAEQLNARLYMALAYHRKNGEWLYPAGLPTNDPRLSHDWRKPAPGMLLAAMRDHRASPERTIMIGDSDEDEAAATAAGVWFVRV